jgi:1,4-dihydroxy-2-naphthoyl-CoA synthase
MKFDTLTVETDDRVAVLTLTRPERMNALSDNLRVEFRQAIDSLDADADVRTIIVRGAGGKAFSTGYDLKDSANTTLSMAETNARLVEQQRFVMSVWHCSKPVIAMIEGYCLAGAIELALCCDVRYCSDDSRIGVLEARFGAATGTLMIPWVIGSRKIAKRMSRVSTTCQRWNKRAINQSFEAMGLHAALRYGIEAATIMRGIGSPEREKFDELRRTEGLEAALQWRKDLFAPFE